MQKVVLLFTFIFFSPLLFAEALIPLDSPLLTRARLVLSEDLSQSEYRLVLSSIKKVNNRWRSQNERTVVGSGSRKTYELRSLLTYKEAQKLLAAELEQIPSKQLLFRCEGLDCGSSSGWANEFFQIKQLYGLDTYQEYSVWALPSSEQKSVYAVLYLVQRGNRRIYLQEDVIVTETGYDGAAYLQPADVKRALDTKGFFLVPNLSVEQGRVQFSETGIELLASFLNAYPQLSVRLVGHDYRPGSLAEQTARSLLHSQELLSLLAQKGIDKKRVSVHGVGSLAPAGREGAAKVEMLPASN